ncbi:alpha/beta hydrolase, partial [uncultured Nevskia sp.]|uniref:alpha/beta hydrolase n=1 Tax=uncultured Nevskia sp. TaxID=228950 RepID=UPI0025EC0CA4
MTAISTVEPGSQQISDAIQITGINVSVPVSISGGTYSINGRGYTSALGSVVAGDIIEVQKRAPTALSSTGSALLTVGDVSARFVVETLPADSRPEPFYFAPAFSAGDGQAVASNTITVSGINTETSISIVGGAYQIDGGPWLSTASTVSVGSVVRLAIIPSATGLVTATVTIGGVAASFKATTEPSNARPAAFQFAPVNGFPLLASISEPITVSGLSGVARIRVSDGQYSLNGTPFVNVDGLVQNGDEVRILAIAQPMLGEVRTAGVQIGSASAIYEVTTDAPVDRFPDVLRLPDASAIPINSEFVTPSLPIRGINVPTPIALGAGSEYSLNGGPFTNQPGLLRWGDLLRIRVATGPEYGRSYRVPITIGPGALVWQLRTAPAPTQPSRPTLALASMYPDGLVLPGSVQTTKPVIVENAPGPVPVSVVGGLYRINDGPYVAESGTVRNGDTVTVRYVMPDTFSTTHQVTLQLGSVGASIATTTTIDAIATTPKTVEGATISYAYETDLTTPLRAHVFLPPGWRATDRRPAYIDWSGGGWAAGGLPTNRAAFWAIEYGMVVVAPDQPVNERFGTYAYVNADDARLVLQQVQQKAGLLGVDPSRVIVTGTSSGGGNAVWTSLLDPPVTTSIGSSPEFRPAAVVLRSGVSSTRPEASLAPTQLDRFGRFVDDISPDTDIDGAMPPYLIFHADADIVFAETANLNLCSRILALGRICEFHNQPGLGHDWPVDPVALETSRQQEIAFFFRLGLLPAG